MPPTALILGGAYLVSAEGNNIYVGVLGVAMIVAGTLLHIAYLRKKKRL